MQANHEAQYNRLDVRLIGLVAVPNHIARGQLRQFYQNAAHIWTSLDKEMVYCRRSGKITPGYTELLGQYNNAINTFDEWHLMAALSY
jgi:hypothetical protein